MAFSGGRPPAAPRNSHGERRSIGLFSLGIGVVLLALILIRGQQAAREGNQELRNDSYWVLVSPLVFSGFGIYLLRTPGRSGGGRSGLRPVAPPAALQRSVSAASRQAEQSQQAVSSAGAEATQRLQQAERELAAAQASAAASEQRLQQAADEARIRIQDLEQQLEQMRQARNRAEADLQAVVEGGSDQNAAAASQALALRQRLDTLGNDLEQRLQAARSAQAELLADQSRELHQLQQQLSAVQAAAVAAREQAGAAVAGLEEQLTGMGGRLRDLEQERNQLVQGLDELKRHGSDSASAALAAAERGRSELEQLLGRLNAQQNTLQSAFDQVLQQERAQLSEARGQLDAALTQLEGVRAREQEARAANGERLVQMEQQIQEAQQAGLRSTQELVSAMTSLEQARAQLHSGLDASRERIERVSRQVSEQISLAREEANRALRLSQETHERLEQFEQSSAAERAVGPAASSDAARFQASYRDACEEIGVVPGSDWTVVRATWRRNLKLWHPDQGGDPQRWMRRNAAYQLLTAWYDFHTSA